MNKKSRSALDRDLFSKFIESPIHPPLINMVRPYVDSCDLKFRLQFKIEKHFGIGERSPDSPALPSTFSKQASPVLDTNWRNPHAIMLVTPLPRTFEIFGRKINGISNSKKRKRVRPSKRPRSIYQYSSLAQRLWGKIVNFSSFFCLSIPKRDLDTKKTAPNIEVCPESLGAMLEY